jgi:mannose-6-phosphate isomerase-like protein (cupin superfamily)
MNNKITLNDILDPISPKVFFMEYWNKKHLILRRNKFKSLYTWADFDKYLNQYPDMKGLQIIDYRLDGDGRWCLDKVKNGKLKLPMLTKDVVYKLWKEGKSFILPFAEYQKKDLVDICHEFERYFEKGQCNVYASPRANSKSFPAHSDNTENFLFHTEGKVKWTLYKEFAPDKPKEILEEFILEAGDLLYIPQYQYHKVDAMGPRILISIHFSNKPKQALNNFQISKLGASGRNKWYDWSPIKSSKKKIKITQERRMVSDNWKAKYFRDKI